MAKVNLKPVLTYILPFLIALGILAYVFKDINAKEMLLALKHLDYSWVLLSIALSIVSHVARAYRWNLLIMPLGYSLSLYRTFLAVMTGYFANLILPRMGEVTKCAVLKKTDAVPITLSLGTVIAERVLDFIVLMSLLMLTIIIEFSRLKEFIFGFLTVKTSGVGNSFFGVYVFGGFILAILLFLGLFGRKIYEKSHNFSLLLKIKNILKEMAKGLMSIKSIENKAGFWAATIIIWIMYYLMAYVVVFSMPQTSGLGLLAGLTILVMGGLGMAAPVQGGIGAYHALVSSVLILYGIKETDGVIFATVLHTSQVLAVMLVGGISILIISFNSKLIKKQEQTAK